MSSFMISYDVRSSNHQYQPLYDQLNTWGAQHLQNSVWFAELNGTAAAVRDTLQRHMHSDDTICVVQVFANSDWATINARDPGVTWAKSHLAA